MTEQKGWRVSGYDAFEEEPYPISQPFGGPHETEQKARRAADLYYRRHILPIQTTQSSGGQGDLGLQDRIFITDPQGVLHRFIPSPRSSQNTSNS